MAKEIPGFTDELKVKARRLDEMGFSFGQICKMFKKDLNVIIKPTLMERWLKDVRGLRSRAEQLRQYAEHVGRVSTRANFSIWELLK